MLTRETIINEIRKHKTEIHCLGVRHIGLFGSFARGEATTESDLDFVVEFEQKSFDNYMNLRELLENLFKRKVDLVTKESIKPRLKQTILSELIDAA